MKKLLTICLLLAATFTVNAQQMNFDETVNYINDKLECCAVYKNKISVTRNGEIKWSDNRINLFDLLPIIVSKRTDFLMENSGIRLKEFHADYAIWFDIATSNYELLTKFNVQADAERVFKALVHLRSLCTKEKDPF